MVVCLCYYKHFVWLRHNKKVYYKYFFNMFYSEDNDLLQNSLFFMSAHIYIFKIPNLWCQKDMEYFIIVYDHHV